MKKRLAFIFTILASMFMIGTVSASYVDDDGVTWIQKRIELSDFINGFSGTDVELRDELETMCYGVDTDAPYEYVRFLYDDSVSVRICDEYEERSWTSSRTGRTYTWTRCVDYHYEEYQSARCDRKSGWGYKGFWTTKYNRDTNDVILPPYGGTFFDSYWSAFPLPY